MGKPRALDLFCGAGGVSVGLARAGYEVTGVDLNPKCEASWRRGMEPYNGTFICADALTYPLEGYDLIHASPPCQAHSSLRHLTKGKVYPELIGPVRDRLDASGTPWVIENVPGAPLGLSGNLLLLCGSMFGLQTPDGRSELRRHRLFETSFPIVWQPPCRHGRTRESLSVCGTGMGPGNRGKEAEIRDRTTITVSGDRPNSANTPRVLCVAGGKAMSGGMMTPQGKLKRRALSVTGQSYHTTESHPDSRAARRQTISVVGPKGVPGLSYERRVISVTGNTPQTNTVHNTLRETFSIEDARAAMGIDWMPMRFLSQAIPPAYGEYVGRLARGWLPEGAQIPLFHAFSQQS